MQPTIETHATHSGGAWVTIGSFDGVHYGHRHIIDTLVENARKNHSPSVVVTFYPHPHKVLRNIEEPFYLCTPEEKDKLIKNMGVDSVLTIYFNHDFSKTPADQFMRSLHGQLAFSQLMIGYDFRLGANREGDFSTLGKIGEKIGYRVTAINPMQMDGMTISSSHIRHLLNEGNITEANRFLGRLYDLSGYVIHGDGRGKHIGIPTANLSIWKEKLAPAPGVYAAFAELDGQNRFSVVNIGYRPTFYQSPAKKSIEVHLLNFDQDIYRKWMRLQLVERIRSEIKFSSADELMDQIHKDISLSKEVLSHAST